MIKFPTDFPPFFEISLTVRNFPISVRPKLNISSTNRYTVNGYRDERDNIVQRRPTIRTENDNFILETPRNRNITLSPGQGGYVRIGNTIIDPNVPYQVRITSSNTKFNNRDVSYRLNFHSAYFISLL